MVHLLLRRLRQRVPVNFLPLEEFFPDGEVSLDDQQLVLDVLNKISENNKHYSKTFLKKLISFSETNNFALLDEVYESLAEVMPYPPLDATESDIITYSIIPESDPSLDKSITIEETPRVLCGAGTTGLRTWEASLFLTQYIIHHCKLESNDIARDINNKTVLELGSGTGLVGMGVLKYTNSKKVIFSDGDSSLVERLQGNLALNGIDIKDERLKCQKLWWSEDNLPEEKVDTIIAADVTYDSDVIPSLISTINEAMVDNVESGLVDVAYVAATVRNEDTLNTWETYLNMGKNDQIWTWKVIDSLNECSDMQYKSIWYTFGTPDILIYQITRCK